MKRENYNEELAAIFRKLAIDVFAVCSMALYDDDLVGVRNAVKEELPFAVSFGLELSESVLETIEGGPNQLYLHHYRQANYKLDTAAFEVAGEIGKMGYKAMPFPASQIIDWRKQRGHINHKKIGVLAGIGWLGRNNLLVHPDFGSRMRFNTVITNMPLAVNKLMEQDCGDCHACIESCPAGAIKDSQEFFDHKGCYEMIDKLRKERNVGHHICGICVAACKGGK